MKHSQVILFALFSISCGNDDGQCYFYKATHSYTNYATSFNLRTPAGAQVDSSGFDIDLQKIDCVLIKLEGCLREIPDINPQFKKDGLKYQCLKIKIAPDWTISECTGAQVFDCGIPQSVCDKAGITRPCKCRCAGTIQNGDVIVTTPNLATLAHETVHLVTDLEDSFTGHYNYCAERKYPDECEK